MSRCPSRTVCAGRQRISAVLKTEPCYTLCVGHNSRRPDVARQAKGLFSSCFSVRVYVPGGILLPGAVLLYTIEPEVAEQGRRGPKIPP